MNPHESKSVALNGGRLITVTFEEIEGVSPLEPQSLKVRQIPVRDYEKGFGLFNDEPALVGFLIGKPKLFVTGEDGKTPGISPESYEQILAAGKEVNAAGFFVYCQRQSEQVRQRQTNIIAAMATLPPEVLKLAYESGSKSTSPTSSRTLSSRQG